MRRRRKTKYYWLPIIGTPATEALDTPYSTFNQAVIDVSGQHLVTGFAAVVENALQAEDAEHNLPLNDIIGNEYVLKRIVGKCFCDVEYTTDGTIPVNPTSMPYVACAAGFYVARIEPDNAAIPNPNGLTNADRLYSPLNAALVREPWIWRRSWILGPGPRPLVYQPNSVNAFDINTQPTAGDFQGSYPWTNVGYGGVLDGPHIDAKTGRRVRQDEALFFGFAAHYLPFTDQDIAGLTTKVTFRWDLRCLGALRRARNRSNF